MERLSFCNQSLRNDNVKEHVKLDLIAGRLLLRGGFKFFPSANINLEYLAVLKIGGKRLKTMFVSISMAMSWRSLRDFAGFE